MINSFSQAEVDTMNVSEPSTVGIKRQILDNLNQYEFHGWYGCKHNSRLYKANGTFLFITVEIDNWRNPSFNLPIQEYILNDGEEFHVPPGLAVGFKALDKETILEISIETRSAEYCDKYIYDKNRWFYETFM